ncbi:heme peroxidase [Coniosporium apollinis]|uniref:Peroxidase n=2 Tax=Coniosporium TaxID=2810619 RepID=A0ABQ9NRP6_9PEZI|nr:heme peroxidase [Cladosporium sp. JES 115]KAJ9665075.1 heme peroxidase [Coniosporium apollinis]
MATAARTFTRALRSTPTATFRTTATRNAARFAAPRQAFRQQSRRGYADGAAPKSSSNAPFWAAGLGAGVLGGGYYLYFQNSSISESIKQPSKEDNKQESKTPAVFKPIKEDYQKVYDAIAKRLEEHDDYDDGSYGPVLLRLGWHASGTYDKETNTGGSNGATMRFAPEGDHGANAGLKAARDFLEPVKAQFPWISYSDLWTLGAVCAVQEMQGPAIPWRPGRADRDVAFCTPDGRLPDGSKDQKHLRAIFGRMGFDDREIVALSGAHALGRCHTDRSGFEGPWTFSPTTMTNDYYKLLLDEAWSWRKWDGPRQFQDVKSKTLMMLPTDMALIKDKSFRPWVEKYAKDNEAFFKDFSRVIMTLLELGVPFQTGEDARMTFKSSFDQ